MANVDVAMVGMEQARKNLRALISSMAAEKQLDAVKKGASVLQASAAARVPVSAGPPSRGGRHLKDAIETEVRSGQENKVKVAIGPASDQYHGIFIELGTTDQPAEPFLRTAAESEGREAIRIVRRDLKREVVENTVQIRKRTRLLRGRRRVPGTGKKHKRIRRGEPTIGGGRLVPAESARDLL